MVRPNSGFLPLDGGRCRRSLSLPLHSPQPTADGPVFYTSTFHVITIALDADAAAAAGLASAALASTVAAAADLGADCNRLLERGLVPCL